MSVRRSFALGAIIKVAGEDDSAKLHAQVADEQQQCKQTSDVNVGDREVRDVSGAVRNLPVTTTPLTAHEEYLREQETGSGVHVNARGKVSLLRRTAQ